MTGWAVSSCLPWGDQPSGGAHVALEHLVESEELLTRKAALHWT